MTSLVDAEQKHRALLESNPQYRAAHEQMLRNNPVYAALEHGEELPESYFDDAAPLIKLTPEMEQFAADPELRISDRAIIEATQFCSMIARQNAQYSPWQKAVYDQRQLAAKHNVSICQRCHSKLEDYFVFATQIDCVVRPIKPYSQGGALCISNLFLLPSELNTAFRLSTAHLSRGDEGAEALHGERFGRYFKSLGDCR